MPASSTERHTGSVQRGAAAAAAAGHSHCCRTFYFCLNLIRFLDLIMHYPMHFIDRLPIYKTGDDQALDRCPIKLTPGDNIRLHWIWFLALADSPPPVR